MRVRVRVQGSVGVCLGGWGLGVRVWVGGEGGGEGVEVRGR